MAFLLYKEDADGARERLTKWWNGGDIGRPAMHITVPRSEPVEQVEVMPQPDGWVTHYSTSNLAYRVNLSARACINTMYRAEAFPVVAPDLAPNCLALYLGCRGIELPGTVWCEPCIQSPDRARFVHDPANFYWRFSLQLAHEQLRLGRGKLLLQFPDLIEGLDTLAAMRGSEKLLVDLIDRPDWVHRCLRQITDCYFHYYDILYDLIRDKVGGSCFWAWAPGRMAKFQCDFSAMISADMFAEFMLPVLSEMCERVSYCMYHWDGPGAICHQELLLSIEKLAMLQWTPGAGAEPAWHSRWWPLYHRTVDAGKRIFIGGGDLEALRRLRKEFGAKLKLFLIAFSAQSESQAEEALRVVAD